MGLATLWKNYLSWTQAVDVAPLIASARRRLVEVAWFLVHVATVVAFVVQSVYLVQGYLEHQKKTNIRLIYAPEAPFPAVTFCNLNPFKKSMVQHSPELTNLLAAYTYVSKVKQAQRKNGISEAARTTMTSTTESHARRKRQPECDAARYSTEWTGETYSVVRCLDGTEYMEFVACSGYALIRTNSFAAPNISMWKDDITTIFYTCFHHFCVDGGCGIYQDGLNAIMAERTCLQSASSNLALSGIVAQALSNYCGYSDANCTLGMSERTGSAYGGNYYHRECGAEMTTVFEDCNNPPQIGVNYTHSYDTTCDTVNYITDMASLVIPAMDNSQCGATCSPPPCAYNYQDACKGLNYNDFLCALSTCNVSTTSSFTSTTTAETTTLTTTMEPTSTDSPSPSTTTEMTTTVLTSTLETTTVPPTTTTELTTTTTDVLTTTTAAETTSTSTATSEPMTTTTELVTTTTVPWTSTTETSTMATTTATPSLSTLESTSSLLTLTTKLATMITDVLTTATASKTTSTSTKAREPMSTRTRPATTSSVQLTSTTVASTTTVSTTTDATSSRSSTSSTRTTASGATSTTKDAQISTSTSTSVTGTTASLAATSAKTETSTRPNVTMTVVSTSTKQISKTSEKATFLPSSLSSTTSKTVPDTTMTTSYTVSLTSTSETATTTSSLVPTSANTGTSTITQATRTAKPTNISATSKKTTSLPPASSSANSTTVTDTTTGTPPPSSTTPTESPAVNPTSIESKTALSATQRLTSTTTLVGESSTGSTLTTATTTSTKLETSTAPVTSTKSSGQNTSPTKIAGSSTPPGLSMRSSSLTSPTETSSFSAAVATSTLLAPSVAAIALTVPTGNASQYASGSSTGSPDTMITGSTREAEEYTSSSYSERVKKGPITTPSAEGVVSLTSPQSTTPTATRSGSASSVPPITVRTTSDIAIDQSESAVNTVDGITGSTTGTTWAGSSKLATGSATPIQRSLLTDTQMSTSTPRSVVSEESTTSVSNRSSQHSNSPSDVTLPPVSSDGHPSSSTNSVHRGGSPATTESEIHRSKAPGSLQSTSGSSATETTTMSTSNDFTTAAQTEENDTATTKGTRAGNFFSTLSSPRLTESTLGGEQNVTRQPTTDDRQSTTRSTDDTEQRQTIDSDGSVSDGGSKGGSRTTATSRALDSNVDRTTKSSNAGADRPNSYRTTSAPIGSGKDLTTTVYEENLKNIKLNLSLDFDLRDLNEEEKKDLEGISNAYGLDPSNDQVVVDAKMKEALQIIAAKMTPEMREILGFKLKDLTSSCIMNGDPCDLENDFKQSFDIDYGNCYTFNHDAPVKYVARRTGTSYGKYTFLVCLRMTITSNSTETLPSSSEEGVKIVVHSQDFTPFPSVEGYKSPVGQLVSLQLTQSKSSRLGAPYGNCSTLDSIAENKQPFYYNGSYTTEGCFRSCFQRNIATACGCADSRFPTPTDMNVQFCDPLEPEKHKCKEVYIEDNGDYFFVDNCQCYDACEHTAYKSQISQSPWPAGGFFYGAYCPLAQVLNFTDCSQFYRENAMTLEVSFAQLGYAMLQEEPATTEWGLFNSLAGTVDLWIGSAMFGLAEFVLIGIQICLWICRCAKELPEVPSLRRRNYVAKDDKKSNVDDSVNDHGSATTSGSLGAIQVSDDQCEELAPKNFPNVIGENVLTRRQARALTSAELEVYDPMHGFESVDPILAQTTELAEHFANI